MNFILLLENSKKYQEQINQFKVVLNKKFSESLALDYLFEIQTTQTNEIEKDNKINIGSENYNPYPHFIRNEIPINKQEFTPKIVWSDLEELSLPTWHKNERSSLITATLDPFLREEFDISLVQTKKREISLKTP